MAEVFTIELPGAVAAVNLAAVRGAPSAEPYSAQRRTPAEQAQQALADEREGLRRAREALEAAADQLRQLQRQAAEELTRQLPELAVAIARKLLAQEIQAERHQIDRIVQEALPRAPADQPVVIHLNPADLAASELAKAADAEAGSLRFVADPAVGRAECLLETDEGVVDRRIETNLQRVAEALKEPD